MALAFLALGFAYGLRCPAVLGKRLDGSLSWWSWVFFLPWHLYVRMVWSFIRQISREPAVNAVTENLIVGRRLLAQEVPPNIRLIVDLTAEFSEPSEVKRGRQYRNFPMLDASAPDRKALFDFIDELPDLPVYVHCAQGHGRTGLFAMAYLVRRKIANSYAEAEKMLVSARPGIALNGVQKAFIEKLESPSSRDS